MTRYLKLVVLPLLLAAAATAALWLELPLLAQIAAGLLLTVLLPGLLLVYLFLGAPRRSLAWVEFGAFGMGAGFGLQIVVMTLLAYLPGGISRGQVLLAFWGLLLALLALAGWQQLRAAAAPATATDHAAPAPSWRQLGVAVAVVLIVGAALRFPDLGYAEYHRDEARTLLLMARAIDGFPNALMAHYKGPADMVVPGALWLLAGRLDETGGRLPFAVANLAALIAALALGWRLGGGVAGIGAALLLAVNGYLIAFSRFLQYQSIVVLESLLVILLLWTIAQDASHGHPARLSRRLTLASFLCAASLLAHYDAAAILLPAAYLLGLLWVRGVAPRRLATALAAPVLLGGALVALFYVPFVLYPGFAAAYTYTVDYRLGGGSFPYNNLVDFFTRAALYNGSYYLLFLTGVTAIFLVQLYARTLPRLWTWALGGLWLGGLVYTFWRPEWLRLGDNDWIWLYFTIPIMGVWFLPRLASAERLVWLWFGSMLLFSLFFVALPRTHVYVFFLPWALTAALASAQFVGWLQPRVDTRGLWLAGGLAGAVLVGIFGYYVYQVLIRTDVEVLRTWHTNKPAGYWHPFAEPTDVGIYGFPLRNGWKAVGALYAQGQLNGMFRTNELPDVVEWYTDGAGVCPRDDRYYVVTDTVETTDDEYQRNLTQEVENEYDLLGAVMVNGEPRLHFYSRDAGDTPAAWALPAYEAYFDAELADPHRGGYRGRVLNPAIQHPLDFRLGENVRLLGYSLDKPSVKPGETFQVRLYWEALSNMHTSYTVFNQLVDLATNSKVGQRDGLPVCDRYPTDGWDAGDVIEDPYDLQVAPDAPPGTYTLLVGMYDAATGARLPVTGADGAPVGDAVQVATINVE